MKGKLIIIEGSDGSGKATQTKRLYDRLKENNYNIRKVEYPNYDSESSSLVKMYLRGDFGKEATDVDPYVCSTFFAVDRYASFKTEWEEFYNNGGIVICDRYTTSNMIHQASKMDIEDRDKYLEWLDDLEFNMYKIPKPDCVIFLDVPVEVSQNLMKDRNNKITGESQKDIHESNNDYLKKSYENSLYIADKFNWNKINCVEDGHMKTIEDIHQQIYSIVEENILKEV